jgi:hypothetical protein
MPLVIDRRLSHLTEFAVKQSTNPSVSVGRAIIHKLTNQGQEPGIIGLVVAAARACARSVFFMGGFTASVFLPNTRSSSRMRFFNSRTSARRHYRLITPYGFLISFAH